MKPETKSCQNCKNNFTVESEDFLFYEKIKVPPPTFCPECRFKRRLMWRNNRSLYSRVCGLCSKKLVSYMKDDGVPVYCLSCYPSDNWDQFAHAQEVDFSKSFFEQFKELLQKQPRVAQMVYGSVVNCDYSNSVVDGKNLYLTFSSMSSENIFYSENVDKSKDCFDCLSVQELSQCSWNVNSEKNYNSHYMYESGSCVDSYFLFDCTNCSNCFMSSNLRNQSYYFQNQKLNKETYEAKMVEVSLTKFSNLEKYKASFKDLIENSLHKFANIQASQSITGDMILNSKNIKRSFDIRKSENVSYSYRTIEAKDIMDCNWILRGELEYESMTGNGGSYHQIACFMCITCSDISYSVACKNSSNCFGCVGLKNAQYCIFNKQYSKEEYFELVDKIKKHMMDVPYIDTKGRIFRYGEFFPYNLSFFGYNESLAHDSFPLSKEEVLNQGFNWFEERERNYKPTIASSDLPDDVSEINESILQEVISCPNNGNSLTLCTTAYRIVSDELTFCKQKNLSLPRFCPNCRHYERLKYRNPVKLWNRTCMCDKEDHNNHEGKCKVEFETSYSPDRLEKVYCEKCYQQEVY
ncbi:MAG TPA: hypothetical protein VJB09_02725 [Candidatus Paceibacterota bacterium]